MLQVSPDAESLAVQLVMSSSFLSITQAHNTPELEELINTIAVALEECSSFDASAPATDEVERALQELREMFPGRSVRITHQWNEGSETDPRGAFVEVCILADEDNDWSAFSGAFLAEATQAVREWAAKEKS